MSESKWGTAGAPIQVLANSDIASLAKNTISTPVEYNNTSGQVQRIQWTLALGSIASVAGDYVQILVIPPDDPTAATPNYPTVNANNMANYVEQTLYLNGTTSAQLETSRFAELPIGKCKFAIYCAINAATLAATGNSLKFSSTPNAIV